MRSPSLRLFAAVACIALAVYLLTLAPTVTGEDSGELITAACTLGIAHPPGYPLWCLLGKLFTLAVPIGSLAWRVNLLSAVLAACASGLLAVLVLRLLGGAGRPAWLPALAAGLAFAFSRDFWSQSVIAEVYSLNILFLALVLLLAFAWTDAQRPVHLYLLTFTYGLSLTNHSTMGPLGILVAAYVLWRTPWVLKQPLLLVNLSGAFLVGFSIILYLPMRSLADPPMDWGDPETLSGLLDHFLRRQYAGVEGVRPRVLSEQLTLVGCFLRDLGMQFTPVLAVLVPWGAWRQLRSDAGRFVLLASLFLASSLGII